MCTLKKGMSKIRHDLCNDITIIKGYIDIVNTKHPDDMLSKALERIAALEKRLNELRELNECDKKLAV